MSLRAKLIIYLGFIHLVFAGLAVMLLLDDRGWLLAVEGFFVLSLFVGIRLVLHFWVPLDLIRTGAELIGERDFTSKFVEVGQPEMDQLIRIYNRMIEQLRQERTRLQEQHYFMDKIQVASPSGIVTLDFDDKIAMVNPSAEQALGLSEEELVGKGLDELSSSFAEALETLEIGESRVIPLQGLRRMKCQKSQFLDQGFQRSFILMEELTEESRRFEQAAYEKVIRLLSHEVNNSVGAVNSLLHSCLNYKGQLQEADRHDFENALQVAINRIDHLNAFMRSFSEVIKLPPPQLQLVDLEQLLRDIEVLMRAEIEERKIAWEWEVQEELLPVSMDKNQMEQVFVNILKNAIEAIGEEGTVTIRLGEMEGRPYVVVEDTGAGIKPDAQENLFTPFFSTKENGQGIGLTMVQEILTRQNFIFSLESPAEEPTRFTIRF